MRFSRKKKKTIPLRPARSSLRTAVRSPTQTNANDSCNLEGSNGSQSKSVFQNGEAGHRSLCLSHAKRALYHLSYIPLNRTRLGKVSLTTTLCQFCNAVPHFLNFLFLQGGLNRSGHWVALKHRLRRANYNFRFSRCLCSLVVEHRSCKPKVLG